MAVVSMEFRRGKSCQHSNERECSRCFKWVIQRRLGLDDKEFGVMWASRIGYTPNDDTVEGFSAYLEFNTK